MAEINIRVSSEELLSLALMLTKQFAGCILAKEFPFLMCGEYPFVIVGGRHRIEIYPCGCYGIYEHHTDER